MSQNIVSLLSREAIQHPGVAAVATSDQRLTYVELQQRVAATASGLLAYGIVTGSTVAIALDDPLDHLVAMLALAHIGATSLSLASSTPEEHARRQLSLTSAATILTGDATPQSKAYGLPTIDFGTLSGDPDSVPPAAEDVADQPWLYVTGSGSTGVPKVIPVTHRQQLTRANLGPKWLPYGPEDSLLSLVSMHFYAAKQRCLEAFAIGASVFLGKPGAFDFESLVTSGQVSAVYGTAFHAELMLRKPENERKGPLAGLHALMIGGSTVSMGLRQRIRDRLTPNLFLFYGTNETHTSTITRPEDVFTLPGGVGSPLPGFRLRVVDAHGKRLPDGQEGLIEIHSPAAICGYVGEGEHNRRVFKKGWFATGDIGLLTPGGQLVHRGRADGMMIISGVNLYPAEVEECLRTHPAVADAHVMPIRHSVLQDVPVALVELRRAMDAAPPHLVEHVKERLGAHALHAAVVVDRIPRNEQGKIQHDAVQALLHKYLTGATSGKTPMASAPHVATNGTLNVAFEPPAQPDALRLQAWLTLLAGHAGRAEEPQTVPSGTEERARFWLHGVLRFALALLHAVRVPMFDEPMVLTCQPDTARAGRWQATIRLNGTEAAPNSVLQDVLKQASAVAKWANNADPADASLREGFFAKIYESLVKRHAQAVSAGKSTFEVLRVARETGVPFRPISGGIYQLGWGERARRIDRSTTDRDSVFGMALTENKRVTAQLLREAGLPAPRHGVARAREQAQQIADRLGYPVVVKPADRERGEGVSVDVNAETLDAAFAAALKLSRGKQVLVEQQVEGVCHRLFITAGRLLYAVRRLPIGVYGDGESTVRELVERERARQSLIPPWQCNPIALDELAVQTLKRDGWLAESVPGKGRFVRLRRIETSAWGGVDEEVTHDLHPDNLRIALDATALMSLEVAGVDIISPDITRPWYENGAVINEVNYAPLLGGGEISRRYLPEYLDRLLVNKGRIPVEAFVGGDAAWSAAETRWQELCRKGLAAFLSSAERTIAPSGRTHAMASGRVLYERTRALVLRKDVGALVVVVQTDEFLARGMPLGQIDRVEFVDEQVHAYSDKASLLTRSRLTGLHELLRTWVH